MGDLVVGLAKSVVEGVLTKAQSAIEEESKLRQSAQRDLVFITGEFEMMHSFLNVANEERAKNNVVRTWVRIALSLLFTWITGPTGGAASYHHVWQHRRYP